MIPEVDFNRDRGEGQLTPQEREKVYNFLRMYPPSLGIEIGTWKGGGSTYIIATALEFNGKGLLHTFELNQEFYDHAVNLYETRLSHLRDRVWFHRGDASFQMIHILEPNSCDFLMLDGSDDPSRTLMEFSIANMALKQGALIFCHDWYGSTKQFLTKGVLELSQHYELLWDSKEVTGMRIYKKLI